MMEYKILETIVSGFTKTLLDEISTMFIGGTKKFYDEVKQFISSDLKSYLESRKDKYSKVKTILHGASPVYLYDIYYPIKIIKRREVLDFTSNIKNNLNKYKYLTIIGEAGSGKSTLVKHMFLKSIEQQVGIPVLIELRYLNNIEIGFYKYIKKSILDIDLIKSEEIFKRFLEKGKFIFFLDGYDELKAGKKNAFSLELKEFVERYSDNKLILTSRPYSNAEHLPQFFNFKIKELSRQTNDVEKFIRKQLNNQKELADQIINSINNSNQEFIVDFLRNPLLLSLYILTFQSNADIPNKKYLFYRRVFNALFSEHDSQSKIGFIRERRSKLNQENIERILKLFSYLTFFEGKIRFDRDELNLKLKKIKEYTKLEFDNNDLIYDLQSSISIWVFDGGEYSYSHKSLHEYFAALFVKELNPKDKSRFYERILDKITFRNFDSFENFLSLLREMDEFDFTQKYYLLILKRIRNGLTKKKSGKKLNLLIKFLFKSISFTYLGKKKFSVSVNIRPEVEKFPYFISDIINELNGQLNSSININKIVSSNKFSQLVVRSVVISDTGSTNTINITDETTSLLIELLNNDSLIKEFYETLRSEIINSEEFVSNSLMIDRGFVDLI